MSFQPIALIAPSLTNFSNWWLKAYQQGTQIPLAIATDATGGTTLEQCEINTQGFPITAGNAVFTPFIDGAYDLFIFPTEEEADSDITANSIQVADNITAGSADTLKAELAASTGSGLIGYLPAGVGAVATTVKETLDVLLSVPDTMSGLLTADTTVGFHRILGFHSAGDGGGGDFYWDSSVNKNTHNGGTIIDPDNAADLATWDASAKTAWFTAGTGSGCWIRVISDVWIPAWFGAKGDGAYDDKSVIALFAGFWVAGTSIDWEFRTYYLGEVTSVTLDGTSPMVQISDINGITFINMPTFTVDHNISVPSASLAWDDVFQFVDCSNLDLVGRLVGNSFDIDFPNGMTLVSLIATDTDSTNVSVDLEGENCLSPFMTNKAGSARCRDIHGKINAKNVTYGTRLVNNGENVHLDINAQDHSRAFFCTGVENVIANVNSYDQQDLSDILIKSYGFSINNVVINLNQFDSVGRWPVHIEFENDAEDTHIRNVTVNIQSNRVPVLNYEELVRFDQKNSSGINQSTSASVIEDIIINVLYSAATLTSDQDVFSSAVTTWSNAGRLMTNLVDSMFESKGFTFVRGGLYLAKFRGSHAANTLSVKLPLTLYPAANYVKVKVWGSHDYSVLTSGFYQEEILGLPINSDGDGTVTIKDEISSIAAISPSTPTISYTLVGGVLTVVPSSDANYNVNPAELSVSVEFLSTL